MNDKLIVIVGFMGCGKTAVAKELSRLLKKRCLDLDAHIQDLERRSPAQIIEDDGELAFRAVETQALRAILAAGEKGTVIALGGGAWAIPVNRELIPALETVVVWLDAPLDLCWRRIAKDADSRPLAPTRSAAEILFSERLPFYRLADLHVEVGDESPTQIAERIAALL
ncbi:MAG TPA: shikimate kinase [Pyrinomonadaceae bacterium]|nr:shikimate kinase [Pyrinomonadaceae bacterium]